MKFISLEKLKRFYEKIKNNIENGTLKSKSAENADTVGKYPSSKLWRSDGATWNPGANVTMTPTENNQEWSFDFSNKNGKTGSYWHVWDEDKTTLLKVEADSGKVSAPYGFAGNIEGTATNVTEKKSATNVTDLGWPNDSTYVPDISLLAYWNGAYSGTSSNLRYSANGEIIGSNNIGSQTVSKANQLQAFVGDDFTSGGHYIKAIRSSSGWGMRLKTCYDGGAATTNDVSVGYADSAGYASSAGSITNQGSLATKNNIDVSNKGATLSFNSTQTIATVDGKDITVKVPSAPSVPSGVVSGSYSNGVLTLSIN